MSPDVVARTCARRLLAVAVAVTLAVTLSPMTVSAAAAMTTRSPYLTDSTADHVTVNLATNLSTPMPQVAWGPAGGSCASSTATADLRTTITVGGTTEYQFRVQLTGLAADTPYCYRVTQGTTFVDGGPRTFRSGIAAGASTPYSFAVLGDSGGGSGGSFPTDESNVMSRIAASGARFLVNTGDIANGSGDQSNYGDLTHSNSFIFGPDYLPKFGSSIPAFVAPGNHGSMSVAVTNWAEPGVVAESGGRYSSSGEWYAFDYGVARFYILTAVGSGSDTNARYKNDYDTHWAPGMAERTWLTNDLAAHRSTPLKFALFHYPLYSDNNSEKTDIYLNGPANLEGLLASNGVSIVFNGHSHVYERNRPQISGSPMVSYVGGASAAYPTEPINKCSAYDAYAIGWSSSGASSCNAPKPASRTNFFSFLVVSVNGNRVTVTPTDSTGLTFDVQTYTFGGPPPSPTTGSIAGTVTDVSSHAAISNATVTAGSASTNTATNGTYRINGLAPAAYTVTASKTGYVSASGSATVTAGTTQTVDIGLTALPPPPGTGSITGTVTDASTSLGIAGATVGDGTTSTTTGTGGIYRLDGLAPGSHTVTASMPNYSPTTATGNVTAGATTTLNLTLTSIAPPPGARIFTDGFESGSLSAWTTYGGLNVEGTYTHTGVFGAQGNTTAGRTYAKKQLASTYIDGYARSWFDVISASGNVNVLRLRTAADVSLGYVTVTSTGHLTFHSDVSGSTTAASAAGVSKGMWHELELHAVIAGSSGRVEVWLDGAPLPELTTTVNLGTTPIGKVQIGEVNGTGTWNVVWDDVAFDTERIG
jgi:hypothetical protein